TSEDLTMEETLQNILEVTVTLTGAEVGNLLLVDKEGNLNQNILSLANDRFIYDRGAAGQALREGLAGWVIHHRRVIRIPDTQKDERWIPLPGTATFTARSVLSAPIVGGSALFGVLTLTHTEPERFTEDHVTLIRLAVDQIASAVRNAHLYDEQRALTNRLATLYEVLRQVGSHLDPYFVAEAAVSAVERLAGWPTVMVLLPDETGNRLVLHAAAGSNLPPLGVSIGITEGVCGRAFRRGETQCVKNVDEDPDYVAVSDHTRSELAVPLKRGDQILGILNVEGAHRFNDEDRQLAASLSEAIALALDNARFYEQIQRYANAIAEERSRFEAMIRSSRDGIVLVDMNLRTVVLNQAALQHLGLAGEPQQWEKRTLHDLLVEIRYSSPEAVHAAIKEIRRMRHGDEPAGEGEISLPPRTLYWLNLPVMSGTTFVGRLLVFRDVTQERLVAQIREDLTYTLVHDLRSPLSSISTALQFLELNLVGEIDEDYAQALDIALGSTDRMLRLIDTILDISGLESGEMPLDRSEFALRPLVGDVERVHLPQIRGKNLRFLNAVPETLPLLHADRDLVERVLQNLLHNAIKFTAAGGKISLTANVCETRPEYLSISISDTGCGIPPDLQPRLFEKFSTGRTLGRGKGLGLTFCRMAVEAHGGRIWVEETSEAGTTFTLTLPCTHRERANTGNVTPRREESRSRR
ncbi:MAG: GAF domain-containing protein, partial [Anaerolineae bacterium]